MLSNQSILSTLLDHQQTEKKNAGDGSGEILVSGDKVIGRAVTKSRGLGISSGYFYWKTEEKQDQKKIPSYLIPLLLVVFTRQLEILVTTLYSSVESIVSLLWAASSSSGVFCTPPPPLKKKLYGSEIKNVNNNDIKNVNNNSFMGSIISGTLEKQAPVLFLSRAFPHMSFYPVPFLPI